MIRLENKDFNTQKRKKERKKEREKEMILTRLKPKLQK